MLLLQREVRASRSRRRPRRSRSSAALGWSHLKPPPPPPQEALPRWRRLLEGFRHSKGRDAEAIHHHYDVSNRFYEMVLGPSMTYTCAVFPTEEATLEEAQFAKYDLVCRKLGLQPGMRLLDIGSGWGGMVRHAAKHYGVDVVGVTLSREQAAWAQDAIKREGLDDVAEVRFGDYRDVRDTGFDAVSSIGLTEHIGIRNYPSYFAFLRDKLVPGGRLLNHCITRPDNAVTDTGAVHRPLRVPRRRAHRLRPDHHRDPEPRAGGPARGEPPRALRADPQGLVREPRGQLGRVRRARSARAPRRSGASTWPARGCPSSATRSSCTRCWRSSPTRTGTPGSRCARPGSADPRANPLPAEVPRAAKYPWPARNLLRVLGDYRRRGLVHWVGGCMSPVSGQVWHGGGNPSPSTDA